jgi:hypothetical protein
MGVHRRSGGLRSWSEVTAMRGGFVGIYATAAKRPYAINIKSEP